MNRSPADELTKNHSDASLAPLTRLANVLQSVPIDGSLAEFLTFPVFACPGLPESHRDIAVFRVAMNLQLLCDFSARYLPPGAQLSTENLIIPEALRPKWDGYLIEEAAVQRGAGILLSDLVITRVWAWAHGGNKGILNLGLLFKNIEKSAKVRRGFKGKGKVTDQDRHALKDTVPELKELQKRLRQEWPESPIEIITFVAREVETSSKMWRLKKNLPHLLNFLAQNGVARDFRGDDPDHITLTPTRFFIKWLAASKNRTEKSVRVDLYKQSAQYSQITEAE